ncbi:HEAT repeat domain-containing protein [Streptomyces sp. LN785]|uniref:HEAT repeat domain-containing protein n=1 Tax=Streptomyces sp. LN785 TaxID=3112983 RepID=UPI003712F778
MDRSALTEAVASGDDRAVFDLLGAVPAGVLAGEDGSTLLAAAAFAGHHEVVRHLVEAGADPGRVWTDGIDPVSWAADRGACEVLQALLRGSREPWHPDSPEHRALRAAQAWIGTDPEDELRRRLGATEDEPVVVAHEAVPGEYGPVATRIRMTGSDGRTAVVETAHRGIVTHVEARLGVRTSQEELTARALFHGQPGHCDWNESLFQLSRRADEKAFGWAVSLVQDPSVDRRRFGTDLLHSMSFDERPFGRRAAEALRPLLRAERDPHTLDAAIAAFAGYCEGPEELRAVLVHANHSEPRVRGRVAMELGGAAAADYPDVLAALAALTTDSEGPVRAAALRTLADCPADTADLRAVMTSRLTDTDTESVLEAAAGLALREDARGEQALERLAADTEPDSPAGSRIDCVRRLLRYRATGRSRPGTGTAAGAERDRSDPPEST